ncbi:MAG TPA: ABC transporter ATP-binding protein [Spirochaetia bacterium]|nr:ABC transporter ATP-binding protein [Spirochaetia bacterium]
MASIRLSNIEKSFPGVQALKDINFDIASGEFFTLLGPSGCGKTTLLRIIAGFYQQDQGSVFVAEKRMDKVPAYDRNTGMVFQNYAVFPHMTVFENVAFGLRNRKIANDEIRERVAKILSMARLSGYEKRTPDQLSGGQQQRVGLARAMVIEPQVLLMDEPLSNLDAKLRVEMREEIRDIQRQLGTTTVYVTHDQEEALVISDRIAVMNAGVVEQIGTPWQVYKHPETVFAGSFVGHMNFIEASADWSPEVSTISVGAAKLQVAGTETARGSTPESVLLAVRPEDVEILVEEERGGGDGLRLECVVEKSTFTGSLIQYSLKSDGGLSLVAQRHRPEMGAIIETGTKVTARLRTQSVHLFEKGSQRRIEIGRAK